MYYEKYLKNKIKSYEGIISIHFHDGGTPEKGSHCIFLLEILIDTVFKLIKNYYSQVLSEELTYIVKEIKMGNIISDKISFSSDDYGKYCGK